MLKRLIANLRRLAIQLGYIALASKLLYPAGYMPAAFADGGPVQLCHSGIPQGWLRPQEQTGAAASEAALAAQGLAAHIHPTHAAEQPEPATAAAGGTSPSEQDEHELELEAWERCDLGALAATAVITADRTNYLLSFRNTFSLAPQSARLPVRPVPGFRSRAPPIV